ncbi:MAG: tetratricopeptide repeat protein, partial [Vampirovibrionales bacterium]
EAEPLYLQALAIRQKSLGENHPDTANSLNNLAGLYEDTGRYHEAKTYLLQASVIFVKTLGFEHPNTIGCISNILSLYTSFLGLSKAEAFNRLTSKYKELFNEIPPEN